MCNHYYQLHTDLVTINHLSFLSFRFFNVFFFKFSENMLNHLFYRLITFLFLFYFIFVVYLFEIIINYFTIFHLSSNFIDFAKNFFFFVLKFIFIFVVEE